MVRKLGTLIVFLSALSLAAAAQERKGKTLRGWGETAPL